MLSITNKKCIMSTPRPEQHWKVKFTRSPLVSFLIMAFQFHWKHQGQVEAISFFFFPTPHNLLLPSTGFSFPSTHRIGGFAGNCFLAWIFDRSYLLPPVVVNFCFPIPATSAVDNMGLAWTSLSTICSLQRDYLSYRSWMNSIARYTSLPVTWWSWYICRCFNIQCCSSFAR